MANYVNYSDLTEKEQKELSKKNRECLEELNEYLNTHENVTYGELYRMLGVPTPIGMQFRPIDRWPE